MLMILRRYLSDFKYNSKLLFPKDQIIFKRMRTCIKFKIRLIIVKRNRKRKGRKEIKIRETLTSKKILMIMIEYNLKKNNVNSNTQRHNIINRIKRGKYILKTRNDYYDNVIV